MMGDTDNKQSRPESGAGTGGTQPSSPGEQESTTRVGTKVDIRGADAEGGGDDEQESPDKMRDGTQE
jgi:hypothetical protein